MKIERGSETDDGGKKETTEFKRKRRNTWKVETKGRSL